MGLAHYRRGRLAALIVVASGVSVVGVAWWRGQVLVETDVVYGVAGGERLLLDVYQPRRRWGNRPAVILIHGGGWCNGSKAELGFFAHDLAREGFVAFAIDYRLAGPDGNRYPAQIDDVQRAVRWVRANARLFQVDPNRVGAFGFSSGGHLAAHLGTRETRDDTDPDLAHISSRVKCVVDTAGPTDLTDPSAPPLFPRFLFVLDLWLGQSRERAPEIYRDASAVTHVSPSAAPFLIFHGALDDIVPVEQSRRLYRALRGAGVGATLIEMEGTGHLVWFGRDPKRWLSETVAFFRRHLADG
jgi:acetyl esterase/lipase